MIEELLIAINSADTQKAKELIAKMDVKELSKRFSKYDIPLLVASSKGQIEIAEFLLNKGVDINIIEDDGNNALILACRNGDEILAKMLIEKGAKDIKNCNYETGLTWACKNNLVSLAKLLIENGSDLNTLSVCDESILAEACHDGFESIINLLIENGADVNYQNQYGQSVWSNCHNKDNAARLIVKTGKLHLRENDDIDYYNKIKFQIDFEQQCQKDIKWLESGKAFNPNFLYKMLTFYTKTYKEKFVEQNKLDQDKFIESNAFKVKEATKICMSKHCIINLLSSAQNGTIKFNISEEAIKCVSVPKPIFNIISEYLLVDLCSEIEASGNVLDNLN